MSDNTCGILAPTHPSSTHRLTRLSEQFSHPLPPHQLASLWLRAASMVEVFFFTVPHYSLLSLERFLRISSGAAVSLHTTEPRFLHLGQMILLLLVKEPCSGQYTTCVYTHILVYSRLHPDMLRSVD